MHYADIIEGYAARAGDAVALVHGKTKRTWAEFEDRAARLAQALASAGLGPDSKVGLLLYNATEYYEGFLAAMKMRMVAINVNYRYVDDELVHLLDDADAEALIFHSSLGESVARITERLPDLKLLIDVDDGPSVVEGAAPYEEVLSTNEPAAPIERQPDDVVMSYTGGTTGLPKGVMYDVGDWTDGLLALVPLALGVPPLPSDLDGLLAEASARLRGPDVPAILACSPLMHTAAFSNSIAVQLYGGRAVTLTERSFDPAQIWRTVERERITAMVIVGDAFAKPLLAELDRSQVSQPYDLSSLKTVISSGVMWSAPVKEGLLEHLDLTLIDGIGATEGAMGLQVSRRDSGVAATGQFHKLGDTKLFAEDGREIEPGSGEAGLIAAGGKLIPRGYYKDPEKSAKTFREIDGKRYAFIGDWGRLEADGRLVLLGRGSGCINTAGEKVYPEEVEEQIKTHPGVGDALVVGVPDERFGQRVAAVVAPREPGADIGDALEEHLKERLAGYKRPRTMVQVEAVKRAPNGKPDYDWAREVVSA
jgi:3-oxocholest-4-en-26-oate---CoA ligase